MATAAGFSIWALGGDRAGDNSQLRRAVDAMQLPYVYKSVVMKPGATRSGFWIRPTVAHVCAGRSCQLAPPWPDLVVTVGRHLSCVALWVKQQSGGRTRVALINAPRGCASDFDLILVSSLYDVADAPNVLRYQFPLTSLSLEGQPVLQSTQPLTPVHVLLIGGPTQDLVLDPPTALSILDDMRRAHVKGGHIAVVSSKRTPKPVLDALAAYLMPEDRLYRFKPDDPDNPYRVLLMHGTTFTVTSDSLSMLIDVARHGKPLVIAPLPLVRFAAMKQTLGRVYRRISALLPGIPVPVEVKRDYLEFQRRLVALGHAVPLGGQPITPAAPLPDESAQIGEGLRRLLCSSGVDLVKIEE